MKSKLAAVFILVAAGGLLSWRGLPSTRPSPDKAPTVALETEKRDPATPAVTIPAVRPQVPPPAEVIGPKNNIAAAERGGVVESITGECGPGSKGNLLIDRRTSQTWSATAPVSFPQEIVFSFFNREPAVISSIAIMRAANLDAAPKEIEVWTSLQSSDSGFTRLATHVLLQTMEDQTVSFDPVQARFVKLRIRSGYSDTALEMGKIHILEADLPNYSSLATRNPEMVSWGHGARYAAQKGIEWLQPATIEWQKSQNCFGCHVQSQVIMGLTIAEEGKYVVSHACLAALTDFTRKVQNSDGTYHNSAFQTATSFAAMALSYADGANRKKDPNLLKAAGWLLKHRERAGEVAIDHNESPIDQGSVMTTSNSIAAFMSAYRQSGDSRYKNASDQGVAWIFAAPVETTQDKVFAILTLSRFGTVQQRKRISTIVAQLKKEQREDGGWAERLDMRGSNAFATGQVLYAFKRADVSVEAPEFLQGVDYLLAHQKDTGAWPQQNSQSGRPSEFAPTMWAVIGLAGSFRQSKMIDVTQSTNGIHISMQGAILFDFDKSELKPQAAAILSQIKISILDQHPNAKLVVEGHTDDRGAEEYNLGLSQRRSAAVADWLHKSGTEAALITIKGYGKSRPRYPNDTEENRSRNRRVEITVLTRATE